MLNIEFQSTFNRYINYGCLKRTDKLLSGLFPEIPFKKNAGHIIEVWESLPDRVIGQKESFLIPEYTGINKAVLRMVRYVDEELKDDLYAAVLHGSLATGEEKSYSDFDGLVIIKNEVFSDPQRLARVALSLSKAYSIMISMDPLQHHGWFVLTERDLKNWPSAYFPPVLFNYSKSLLNKTTELDITYMNNQENSKNALLRLTQSISRHLHHGEIPDNTYQLKGILSEFMLLPTLYMQHKTGEGIFKKFSFSAAAGDFSEKDWSIMNEVSQIREKWNLNSGYNPGKKPIIVTPAIKKLQIKQSMQVPAALHHQMDSKFIGRMLQLNNLIRNSVQ